MSIFIYRALNKDRREEQESFRQAIKKRLLNILNATVFGVVSEERKNQKSGFSFYLRRIFRSGVNSLDRMFLVRHLSAILKSGINLRESLEILEEDTTKPALKAVLIDAKKIWNAASLSATFAAYKIILRCLWD